MQYFTLLVVIVTSTSPTISCSEAHCDTSCKNHTAAAGSTPLHIKLSLWHGHAHNIYLLSTGKVDPLARNIFGFTPVNYASAHDNCYDLLSETVPVISTMQELSRAHIHKLILTGYMHWSKKDHHISTHSPFS